MRKTSNAMRSSELKVIFAQARDAAECMRALLDHAETLVALLEACELSRDRKCDEYCRDTAQGWSHASACRARSIADDHAIDDAINAIHAIADRTTRPNKNCAPTLSLDKRRLIGCACGRSAPGDDPEDAWTTHAALAALADPLK